MLLRPVNMSRVVSRRLLIGSIVPGALGVTGVYFMYSGLKYTEEDAPIPVDITYSASAMTAGKVVGSDGLTDVPVDEDDGTGDWENEYGDSGNPVTKMKVSSMSNMTIFIPEARCYSHIRPSSEFDQTRYSNFEGLRVPGNPKRTSWYSDGAPLVGEEEGTTLLAGHVSRRRSKGSFSNLYRLTGGEVVWTRDDSGQTQKWIVHRVYSLPHTDFPQEYWRRSGRRQLVVATCGGKAYRGYHSRNVFIVCYPDA